MSIDFIKNKFFNNFKENKYILITTFPVSISNLLYRALNHDSTDINNTDKKLPTDLVTNIITKNVITYFNDYGVITIAESKDNDMTQISRSDVLYQINNPITLNNTVNLTTNNIVTLKSSKHQYVFSQPLGKFLIHIESKDKITLRYNPIPQPGFTQSFDKTNFDNYDNKIALACIENKMEDPVCACINVLNSSNNKNNDTELCVNDLVGGSDIKDKIKKADRQAFDTMFDLCDCSNTNCTRLSHPYNIAWRTFKGKPCPSNIVLTICNTSFNAGGNLNASGANIAQGCSANSGSVANTSTSSSAEPSPISKPTETPISKPTGTTLSSNTGLLISGSLSCICCIVIIILIIKMR